MIILDAFIRQERLDWFGYGISSANRTGAFIACLIIATWILFAFRIRWISLLTWGFTILLFYFLVQTASRGAFVAFVISGILFLFYSRIQISRKTIFNVLFWGGCAFIILIQSTLFERIEEMLFFRSSSANCRLDIYLSGIKMLTDAPYGLESPIETYMQWYQDPDDSARYLSMINSHLEFLCAHGFLLRLGYIVFWIFIFSLLFPISHAILPAACFSVWVCFALCATFSNIANYWVVWIIPVILFIFGAYYNRNRLGKFDFYFLVIFLSIAVFITLHLISNFLPRNSPLSFLKNGDVLVGTGITNVVIFKPSERILGTHYGSEIALSKNYKGSAILVSSNAIRGNFNRLLLSSDLPEEIDGLYVKEMIFLNAYPPDNICKYNDINITAVIGRFSDWHIQRAWEITSKSSKCKINLYILSGVADYIPNWTRFISHEIH